NRRGEVAGKIDHRVFAEIAKADGVVPLAEDAVSNVRTVEMRANEIAVARKTNENDTKNDKIHTTADQSAKHHCSPAPCKQMKRKSDNCHNTNLSIHVRERICIRLAEKNIIAVGKGKKRNHDPIERTPY